MKRLVYVITGAAGSGKTSVQRYLIEKYHMSKVITHTTRAPRQNERDGVDYYFESPTTFPQNHYLEQVQYSSNQYGSSYEGIERAWQNSSNAVIVLDTKGAITYANELGDQAVIIFMQVADFAELAERMKKRGDSPELIEQRLASPENQRDLHLPQELVGKSHVISNVDWEATKQQVDQVITETK
ncbi:AAA family ATPase [Lentilactobacillus senioris]|uniref:guanylate kinase n=1 Tax=Lentilactobacillus senioris TaxID=931534 RepID=UPI00227F001D|nr:AAA family ATPase [Lentilactobacillus senioris]MCY9806509.1 AAA family ATPase [Lentilactobacillus senioris]